MMQKVGGLFVWVMIASAAVAQPTDAGRGSPVPASSKELIKRFPPIAVAVTKYQTLVKEQASHMGRILRVVPGGARLMVVGKENAFWKVLYGNQIAYVSDTQVVIDRDKDSHPEMHKNRAE